MGSQSQEIVTGEGYAVGCLDALGEGPGFRKIRPGLGVTAFGINAIVLPPGYDTGGHAHEIQEETYFVHAGHVTITFGDGATHELEAGGLARVDPTTVRSIRNVGDVEAVIVVAGGRGGYVERDGIRVTQGGFVGDAA